jgi:curved DNA-binding protein CbpA
MLMTKPFDPYKVLGVPRDADTPTVRKAYRRMAKTTHPDAGGDCEAFQQAARAVAILDDPAKRERYDRTGSVEDDPVQSPYHDALAIIMPIIAAGVQAWASDPINTCDIEKITLFVNLRDALEKMRSGQLAEVDKAQRGIDKLRKLAKRTRRKDGTTSPIALAMEGEARRIETVLEPMRRKMAGIDAAIALVKDHKFDPEKASQVILPIQVGGFIWS